MLRAAEIRDASTYAQSIEAVYLAPLSTRVTASDRLEVLNAHPTLNGFWEIGAVRTTEHHLRLLLRRVEGA